MPTELIIPEVAKLELGGGSKRRDGFFNIDIVESYADLKWELSETPWPLPDNHFEELYSSHCLEHVQNIYGVLNEALRVSKIGAQWEIRVPAPTNDMAMCAGHVQVISEQQMHLWVNAPEAHWHPELGKKLELVSIEVTAGTALVNIRKAFPQVPLELAKRIFVGGAHETRGKFLVVSGE